MADVKLANQHANHNNPNKGGLDPSMAFMTGLTKNVRSGVNNVNTNETSHKPQPIQATEVQETKPINGVNANETERPKDLDYSRPTPLDNGFPSKVENGQNEQRTQQNVKPIEQQHQQQPNQNFKNNNHIKETGVTPQDETTYDPYLDLQKGKTEEEVLTKLKTENTKLRKELKSISDDLTVLLEKKKTKKAEKSVKLVKDIVANVGVSEEGLRSELEIAQKQLLRYQKEVSTIRSKYQSQASYEKYVELQESLYQKESRIEQLQSQKKIIEKNLRDYERTLDVLLNESDTNVKVNNLTEETRLFREKIKDLDRKKETMERHAQNREVAKKNLVAELQSLKQEYQRIQQITKFEGPKDSKTDLNQRSTEKVIIYPRDTNSKDSKKGPGLECTEENYNKLMKEWKILQKSGQQKAKKNEQGFEALKEQYATLEKGREDAKQKLAEKQKEIALLNTKIKDLSRIVRHQAVAPLKEDEVKEVKSADFKASLIKKDAYMASKARNNSKFGRDPASPKKPQPNHLLVDYAQRHKFQMKGFRKDERGKAVNDDEGVNFNDKDIVGKQKVKIIAVDVWYDEQKITGIQAVYENNKGEIIEGGPHVVNAEKSKMVTFETLEEDYVKEFSGFMNKNETMIECLIMRTFRGETMKVGQPNKDSKLFKFDINELEYPAILYGSVKEDEHGNGRLSRLGVLILSETIEERLEAKPRRDNSPGGKNGNQGNKEEEFDEKITERKSEKGNDEGKNLKTRQSEGEIEEIDDRTNRGTKREEGQNEEHQQEQNNKIGESSNSQERR